MTAGEAFEELLKIMQTLRSEHGCPWDRAQTPETLRSYLIEEAYELLESIDHNEKDKIKEELGDLLFQIVFQAQIAAEEGAFNMKDVLEAIIEKMLARHPHVFGEETLKTKEEVLQRWEEHKKREGKLKDSIMEGLPKALPALLKALRAQERAARVGFDWDTPEDVLEKVQEELQELKQAIKSKEPDSIIAEIGDLLFSIVNLSRQLNINPEDALRRSTDKFIKRFQQIEYKARQKGLQLHNMSIEEMNHLWEQVKKEE